MQEDPLTILARGTQRFCGLEFLVAPEVLIPRQETELLANTASELLKDTPMPRIIDMCCGSGNLAGTLAVRFPDATVYGADLTASCVRLAQRNLARHWLGDRVSIHQGHLFDCLSGLGLERSVDLVVCNPPYIPDKRLETHSRALLEHEPREAFAAGAYGMDIISEVLIKAADFLRTGAPLCFEFGQGQDRMCKWLIERSRLYDAPRLVSNEDGVPRVAVATRL